MMNGYRLIGHRGLAKEPPVDGRAAVDRASTFAMVFQLVLEGLKEDWHMAGAGAGVRIAACRHQGSTAACAVDVEWTERSAESEPQLNDTGADGRRQGHAERSGARTTGSDLLTNA